MKYFKFENIAYQFEPSSLVADSCALSFIRSHSTWLRIDVNEHYYRVRFSELVSTNNKPTVYVANCCYCSSRCGHVISSTSPSALLRDVCDYVGVI